MVDKDLPASVISDLIARAAGAAARKVGEVLKPHINRARGEWQWKRMPKALAAEKANALKQEQRADAVRRETEQKAQAQAQNRVMQESLEADKKRFAKTSVAKKEHMVQNTVAQTKACTPKRSLTAAPQPTRKK